MRQTYSLRPLAVAALFLGGVSLVVPQFASGAQTVSVSATDNAFSPQNVSVLQGDTVRWFNNGKMPHTVTADNGAFDSPTLDPGQAFQWTFNTPGTYRYYCALHGGPGGYGMAGIVTVGAPNAPVQQNVALTQTPVTQAPVTQTVTTQASGNPAVDTLRTQITLLLQQITALQQRYGGAPATGVPVATGTVPSGATQCPLISRSLKRGAQGDDVARLQRFLALDREVYPEAQVTGYYGALTEAAIKRFQCKNKLVCEGTPESTGYGVTGPRTAALLALQCPDTAGNVGGFLKVNPLSGPAPLPVTIEATVNATRSCSAATYEVDYGDGTPKTVINVPNNYCNELRQVLNHTYASPGTFVIVLRSGIHQVTSAITVGGVGIGPLPASSIDTFSATPRSGSVPFTVTFKGVINAAANCNASAYTLNFGDGASTVLSPSGCSPNALTVTHAYTSPGNFVARLVRDTGSVEVGSVTISATGSTTSSDTLNANPTSGTKPLGVNFTGIINSQATCNAGPYTLDFGDGQTGPLPVSGCLPTSFTVAHTYGSAGTFVVNLKSGSTALKTVTITVSGGQGTGYGEYFSVTPGSGGDVFAVAAEFEVESSCAAYQLNWGDGSALVSQSQGTCSLNTVQKQFVHQYVEPGSYTITLKRGPTLSTTHSAGITISE